MHAPLDSEILLVSDHPANLLALEVLLEGLPARALRSSLSAVNLASIRRTRSVAVALVDAPLIPSTIETIRHFQGADDGRRIPVLLLTAADPGERDLLSAYAGGVADFIFKPVVPEILQSKVRVFLDLYSTLETLSRAERSLRTLNEELSARVSERTSELEAIQMRQKFLLDASKMLNQSLDMEVVMDRVVHSAVPQLADWCAIDTLAANGSIKRLAIAHPNPRMAELVETMDTMYPQDPNASAGIPNVLRTGVPELVTDISQELLESLAQDADHLKMIRMLELHSYICVPMKARRRVLGVLTFASAREELTYGRDDLSMAEQLAERAASAIDNAMMYRETRDLFEQASDGIFIAGPEGTLLDVNASGCRLLGWDRSELLNTAISDLVRPDELHRLQEVEREVANKQAYRGRWDLRKGDGSYFSADLAVSLLSDGRRQAIVRAVSH